MSQIIEVTLVGFEIGKYTYFGRNKTLCRRLTNNPNGKIVEIHSHLHNLTELYKIQGKYYKPKELAKLKTKVKLKEILPF